MNEMIFFFCDSKGFQSALVYYKQSRRFAKNDREFQGIEKKNNFFPRKIINFFLQSSFEIIFCKLKEKNFDDVFLYYYLGIDIKLKSFLILWKKYIYDAMFMLNNRLAYNIYIFALHERGKIWCTWLLNIPSIWL